MTFVPSISEEDSDGLLRSVYEVIRGQGRDVANILKVQSLDPLALQAHYDLYTTLMFGRSELSRIQREMIGVVVASLNYCHY